jgi:hypothetical protein
VKVYVIAIAAIIIIAVIGFAFAARPISSLLVQIEGIYEQEFTVDSKPLFLVSADYNQITWIQQKLTFEVNLRELLCLYSTLGLEVSFEESRSIELDPDQRICIGNLLSEGYSVEDL